MKQTQIDFVKQQLVQSGVVTRNQCLRNYISRLGAIIHFLKQEGWGIEGGYVKTECGRDYAYQAFQIPHSKQDPIITQSADKAQGVCHE